MNSDYTFPCQIKIEVEDSYFVNKYEVAIGVELHIEVSEFFEKDIRYYYDGNKYWPDESTNFDDFEIDSQFELKILDICKEEWNKLNSKDEKWYQSVFLTTLNWAKSNNESSFEIILNSNQRNIVISHGHEIIGHSNNTIYCISIKN